MLWPLISSIFQAAAILALVYILWYLIVEAPNEEDVTGFRIFQGDNMSITGIKPGSTGTFTQSPLPAGAVLPAGVVTQWASSDTTNAPVTASADGTGATVAVPATANVTGFSLTVSASYTDAAGAHNPSTTVSVPINLVEVTGFDIEQTS